MVQMKKCCKNKGDVSCELALAKNLKEIALVGNPNVGKSSLFNYLTGMCVAVSNYPGTSVEIAQGIMKEEGVDYRIVDLPGTYSLVGSTLDEKVAIDYLRKGSCDVVVNIVDATLLERNLFLSLQLKELGIPFVIGLNFYDDLNDKKIVANVHLLSKRLGVPIIPIDAVRGSGVPELMEACLKLKDEKKETLSKIDASQTVSKNRHIEAAKIMEGVLSFSRRKRSFAEKFDRFTTEPVTGMLFLIGILALTFYLLFTFGGWIADFIDFLFMGYIAPVIQSLIAYVPYEAVRVILDWTFIDGVNSGLQIAFPFVFVFYIFMAILEDSGYLSRMSYLLDKVMHKIGLHGTSVVPMLLGFGCTVPAILATRILPTKRERILTTVLINMIPCSARMAVILGATSRFVGFGWAIFVYLVIVVMMIAVGFIMAKLLPGKSTGMIMELPKYRVPRLKNIVKKSWVRLQDFFFVAFPIIIIGSATLGVLNAFGLLELIMNFFEPFMNNVLQLPAAAGVTLIYGILRKEMALEMLVVLGGSANLLSFMTPLQIVVFTIVVTLYFPCIGSFAVMKREFGLLTSILISSGTVILAFSVGAILSRVIGFLGLL